MIAAKHLDPVVGIDVHIVQPPGPVPPVPIPHPYVGLLLDPGDYLPGASTVNINGLPRATAGTGGMAMPSHLPLGGVFVKPPTNESTVFMGSLKVRADDEPLSFLGLPVLTCQDVGAPAPPRKKRRAPKSLTLPTTVVLAIPAGPPVMVGGPPTILMPGLGDLVAPLARGMVKARKAMAKKSRGFRRVLKRSSRYLHAKAARAMDALGLGARARNRVHRALCTVTGHPVDVATGKVFTEMVDFELPGPIPLVWDRVWYSTSRQRGPLGLGWHHAYDLALIESDGAVAVRLADGRVVAFPALAEGESALDRREKLTLAREWRGYVLRTRAGLSYVFSAEPARGDPHVVVAIEDRSGNQIVFRYDRRGRLAEIVDSGGRVLAVASDDEGRIVEIRGPHPDDPASTIPLVRYAYDGWGQLVEARDALGQPTRYEYHRGGLLARETNRNGLSFYFTYDGTDEHARCVRTWGDGGIYDHKLKYDDIAGETRVENSRKAVTRYLHRDGLVWKTVDAMAGVRVTRRNEHGEVVAEIDPVGKVTAYTYDERGNPASILGPDGAQVTLVHDDRDLLLSATDPVGGRWSWHYDERGRVLVRVDPLGARTEYQWGMRMLAGIADAGVPAETMTGLVWDEAGNLTAIRTPDGAINRWEHDRLGRVVAATDPRGNGQRRTLDLLGRVVRVLEPDGNVVDMTHDPEGNRLRVTDRQTDVRFTFGGLNRLLSRSEAGTTVVFEYDTEERLVGIRNELGHAHLFRYDPAGRLLSETGFDGIKRRYMRDPAGRVTRAQRAPGFYTLYSYDAADRVVGVEHSDGTRETFAYRPDGALLSAINATAAVTFERDLLGRVLEETQGSHAVTSTFDARGLRTAFRSTLGAEVTIERNIMGDVLALHAQGGPQVPSTDAGVSTQDMPAGPRSPRRREESQGEGLRLSFERDLSGLELTRTLPGGLQVRWERDTLGRPVSQQIWVGASLHRTRQYTWAFDDRLQRVVDSLRGPVFYTHDQLGNLISAQYGDGAIDLRMPDAVGNLFRSPDRRDRTFGPAGQLIEDRSGEGTTRYEYDPEGNRNRKIEPTGATWEYHWNGSGMLTRVVRPDGAEVTFGYDALGRRVWKQYRGKITRWVWDGNVPLHQWVELAPAAAPKLPGGTTAPVGASGASADTIAAERRTVALNEVAPQGPPAVPKPEEGTALAPITWLFEPETFTPVGKLVNGERHGIVTDHLGTPAAMYDSAGREVWAAEIGVWGDLRDVRGDRSAVPFRWPGQYEDEETGLHYNRFRYYDPGAGEYVSQDPIGLAGGMRLYWAGPTPTSSFDPLGLTVVIGEGQADRVVPYARSVGAKTIKLKLYPVPLSAEHKAMSLAANREWIREQIQAGETIIDIGRHPARVAMGEAVSEWYVVELEEIAAAKARNQPVLHLRAQLKTEKTPGIRRCK